MPISNTSPYLQLWATGASGGHGLFSVNGDGTGMTGYQLSQFYQNTTDNVGTPAVAEGLFRPSDMVFDTVHGKFFIADSNISGHNRILQGNIADLLAGNPPALTVLYNDGGVGAGTRIDNLEVDPNSGIVYFTHGDNLEKVLYDTANQTPTLLFNANVTAATSPSGVANPTGSTNNFFSDMVINFATGEIYLSSTRIVAGLSGDSIQKNYIYQLTGLTPASGTNAFTFGVANSGTARLLVFSPQDNEIGTNTPLPGEAFPKEEGALDGLAIDPATNTLYFSTATILLDHDNNSGTPPQTIRGGIFAYQLSGNPTGTYTEIFQQNTSNGPQGLLGDLEIDPTTGRWYVTDYTGGTAAAGDEAVWTGNLNGTGTPTLFSLINDPAGQIPSGITLNIAPTLVGTETGAVAAEGAGAGSGFSASAFGLTALDSGDYENADQTDQLSGAMVRISAGFGSSPGSAEQLTINGTTAGVLGSGIAYAYNAGTGVMTLTGISSFANYEAALALVAYAISGDNPDNYGASTSRTLSYSVFDGLLLSDEYDTIVTIAGTNDAPVNMVGGPVALLETDPPAAITGLSVSDIDADPANDAIQVTLSVTLGTITVSTSVPGGITAGDVTGNGTGTVTITATQNAINATFAAASGVTYAPGASGVDTLTMATNDLGQTGAGGAQQDTDLVVITVINVNDPPTAPANNSVGTAEDIASAATAIGASDPDGDGLTYSEKPGFEAANGTVTFDSLNGTFTYTPDADFNGSDSFTILIDDGNGGTAEQVVSVTVTPVNDDPTAPAAGSVSTAEDSASAAAAIGASDVDGDSLTYSEKAGAEASNGSVTFDQINGTYTYAPDANFNGSDSFTILIDDGNGGTTEQVVSVTVTAVNDAPTVVGDGTESAAPIVEDVPSGAGQTVASLFGGQYSDAADQVAGGSSADAFAGIAVTANGSNPAQGQWQYHNGAIWVNIGPASNGAAVLLAASTSIRFNPALNFTGSAPTLLTHLVDASAGAIVSGALANLSVTGGTTPYSNGTVTLSQEVTPFNDSPTGVTGTLQAPEDAANGSAVGTLVAQDPDSGGPFTYTLLNNAGGRFAMDSAGNVTVADGLLLDYEQQNVHVIRVRVTDDQGASSEFDVNVGVIDVLGEDVDGDGRDNIFWGGAEADALNGNGGDDTLKGGGGGDTLNGGSGSDWIDGGAGMDVMSGGSGGDIFVFRKGEANGDLVLDFKGQGSGGDEIHLFGYAAGTTFTRIGNGNSDLYKIDDHGFIEYVTIEGPGHVPLADVYFFP